MSFENHMPLRRPDGYQLGQRETLDAVERLFAQWAETHPDAVVRDERWGFVNKIRSEVSKHG